ncbi:MAG: DUF1345 domain-containing protein [Brevundimonas sp.]|nr:MAG: DUF1345 domain-containing protein [Brevundimonas sp.]
MADHPSILRLHGLLFASAAAGLAVGLAAVPFGWLSRAALGGETAMGLFIAGSLLNMARSKGTQAIRERAAALDQGGAFVLPLALCAALGSVGVVIGEAAQGRQSASGALLAVGAVTVSWLFTHVIFALHYAHRFYAPEKKGVAGGLLFPGEDEPDYWDFLHFALIIGVASQTADVQISSRPLRRLATVHSLTAFLFNTVVLALTVNLAVTLMGQG